MNTNKRQSCNSSAGIEPSVSADLKMAAPANVDERYYRMIDEIEDYAIILLDETGTVMNWNKGVLNIKGYTAEEIVGKKFSVFYRPEDLETGLPEKLLNEAKQNGRALHEGWRVKKDGTLFWGNITITALHNNYNEVIGYTKLTRDLTERKNNEERLSRQAQELTLKNRELSEQKEFVEQILDSSVDIIAVLDRDLKYVCLNKSAQEIYGRDDLIGKKIHEAFPQVMESGMYDDLLKVLTGKPVQNSSYKSVVLNRYFENYYIPLKNEHHEVYGVLAIAHDNSILLEAAEKVNIANEQLEKKNEELERSNISLEQFAYVSSHDLQEPLRKIQTFSDLVLTRMNDENFDAAEYLRKINAAANRMSLLISDLLNFSRLSKTEDFFETVNLDSILDQVIDDFEVLIKQKEAVIKRPSLPTIRAIPIQMNQLFYNMISNALKFCDKSPEIIISSRMLSEKEVTSNPQLNNERQYLNINFSDNGIGFDQENASQIFEVFKRLHSRHQYTGSGIGLSICKKIVDNHGGYISASGNKNKGASFDIYLGV